MHTTVRKVVIGHVDATKLGSLEKTVITSLFHSGLHSGTNILWKNDVICLLRERQIMPFFDKKKTKKSYDAILIF